MRWLALLAVLSGCGGGCNGPEPFTRQELLDPETCADCHPTHYEQWAGSMHAYAGSDPVFVALNDKGHEETNGELGDFCVSCHSPMAVIEGETDGSNVADVPEHLKGVTCAFCHLVTDVEGTHNNPLVLGKGTTLYGGQSRKLVDPGVHTPAYSELHDGSNLRSSDLCGSCHDIVTPLGAHIERTYLEWEDSIYSEADGVGLSCGSACHMLGHDDKIADYEGVEVRRRHDHDFAGVDTALIDWPGKERQLELIQAALDRTVLATLCVGENAGSTTVQVNLENVAAGHAFPSGATADRRVWVEVVARQGGTEIWSKGAIADDEVVQDAVDADPTLFTLYDTLLDEQGEPTHFFWEAADTTGELLMPPWPGQSDPQDNHINRQWIVADQQVDEVEMKIHIRPMPLDLLDELVDEGRLDPAVRDAMPTLSLDGANLVWTPETGRESGGLSCVP